MSNTSVTSEEYEPTAADEYVSAPEPVSRDTIDAERALIGYVLAHPGSASDEVLTLPGECFTTPEHRVLWEVATERAWKGLGFDLAVVMSQLQEQHPEFPALPEKAKKFGIQFYGTPGVVPASLADEVRNGHGARQTEQRLTRAWQHLASGRVDLARDAMASLDPDEGLADPWTSLDEAWEKALNEAEDPAMIVPTPWPTLNRDYLGGGLKAREVHIAAGLAGTGKTALAQTLADHVARRGINVAVFSLEMEDADFARRSMSTSGAISMSETMRPKLDMTAESYGKVDEVRSSIGGRVFINDEPDLTIQRVRSYARMAVRRHQVQFIVVDYAQLVGHDNGRLDERERITKTMEQLKHMAKELDIPVFLLAQPNRMAVLQGRKLTMSDLHGSGDLEKYAATVLLLNKVKEQDDEGNEVDSPFVDFDLDKNRYGKCGSVRMLADLSRQTFEEMSSS